MLGDPGGKINGIRVGLEWFMKFRGYRITKENTSGPSSNEKNFSENEENADVNVIVT